MKISLIAILLLLLTISCEQNTEEEPEDQNPPVIVNPSKADSIAQIAWSDLKNVVSDDPLSANEADFDSAEVQFNDALTYDPNNATANFGLAIIKMLKVQYNQNLTNYIDSLLELEGQDSEPSAKTGNLLTRPFSFLLKSPELVYHQTQRLYKAPDITINEIQELIDDELISVLKSAISFLAIVETQQDFFVNVSNGQDSLYLDLGEVYMLDAALHSLLAGLEMITLLDVDILDSNGSYNWIDDIDNYEEDGIDYTVEDGPNHRNLHLEYRYDHEDAVHDSMLVAQLVYNYTSRPGFLGIRPTKTNGSNVISAIQGIAAKLAGANNFIHNSRTHHTNNLISLSNLTEIDSDIADGAGNTDNPNFVQSWTSLADVIDFFNDMVNGPVTFNETIDTKTVNITINLAAFFNNFTGPASLLPKFNIKSGNWIMEDFYHQDYYIENNDINLFGNHGFITTITNVDTVFYKEYDHFIDPIQLVDDANQPINEDSFPYFDDYTFGGLFPNMTTRQQWVDLLE